MVNLEKEVDGQRRILNLLNSRDYWCFLPVGHGFNVTTRIEEDYYADHPEQVIAYLCPFQGSVVTLFFTEKSGLSASDLIDVLKAEGVPNELAEQTGSRDIIYLGGEDGAPLVAEFLNTLAADQVLLDDIVI